MRSSSSLTDTLGNTKVLQLKCSDKQEESNTAKEEKAAEKKAAETTTTQSMMKSLIDYNKFETLSSYKEKIKKYYGGLKSDSQYIQDVETVVHEAEEFLAKRISENQQANNPEELGIVLDIDETTLSNEPSLEADDFANTPTTIDARYHAANAPAIAPVLRLYNDAIKNGVSTFFVTARKPLETHKDEDLRPYAEKNLLSAGYSKWAGLFMPQGDDMKLSTSTYKANIRKELTETKKIKIVLNLGDQDSDFDGGYSEHNVKIPNYVYSTSAVKR